MVPADISTKGSLEKKGRELGHSCPKAFSLRNNENIRELIKSEVPFASINIRTL
jgi:hypothetical protein